MEVTGSLQIVCPIRGQLKVNKRSKDGLSASEEFYRVEAIKYLLSKSYPKENFWIEPIIKRFGNSGRNSFRSDFAVLDVPATTISSNDKRKSCRLSRPTKTSEPYCVGIIVCILLIAQGVFLFQHTHEVNICLEM